MILIVGCGFLGNYLLKYIRENTSEKVIATSRNIDDKSSDSTVTYVKCDVTNESNLRNLIKECGNQELTVFYFASSHNIDVVFEKPVDTEKVNVEALKKFLDLVPNIKKFFYASTDCVYGEGLEKMSKFAEVSSLNPINEYGRQKAKAEKIVCFKGFTVLRFPFMIGSSLTKKPHFYDIIYSALKNGNEIELIDGMRRSVISYSQAAELIYRLSVLKDIPQIINVCGDECLSKFEIGLLLKENNNLLNGSIIKISEEDGKKFFKDARASYVAMDNSLLKSVLNIEKIILEETIC